MHWQPRASAFRPGNLPSRAACMHGMNRPARLRAQPCAGGLWRGTGSGGGEEAVQRQRAAEPYPTQQRARQAGQRAGGGRRALAALRQAMVCQRTTMLWSLAIIA